MNEPEPSQATAPTPPPVPVAVAVAALPAGPVEIPYAQGNLVAPYVSAVGLARMLVWVARCGIGLEVVTVLPAVHYVLAWHAYDRGYDYGAWDVVVLREMTISEVVAWGVWGAREALGWAMMLGWLVWVYRTYKNLPALGNAGLTYSPGWAVAYWFIPLFNLFRPLQVMREAWKASDPGHAGGTAWKAVAAPALLGWWWAFELVSVVVNTASEEVGESFADQPRVLIAAGVVDLGMIAWDIGMLLLTIRVLRGLTERQERRADAVGIPAGVGAAPAASS